MPQLFIGNDHSLELLGLRRSDTLAFLTGSTVTARLLDGLAGSEVSGVAWPLSMSYLTPAVGESIGGDSTTRTVVKSISTYDLTVTVGATNALQLTAGSFVWVLHHEDYIWKVRLDAAAAAAGETTIHLEPWVYPDPDSTPKAILGTAGEPVELVDGNYRAVMDAAVAITKGKNYYAEITAAESGIDGQWVIKAKAQYRQIG